LWAHNWNLTAAEDYLGSEIDASHNANPAVPQSESSGASKAVSVLLGQNVPKFEENFNEEHPVAPENKEEDNSEPANPSVTLRPRGGFNRSGPRFRNNEKEDK
jgi:hypothetical protein